MMRNISSNDVSSSLIQNLNKFRSNPEAFQQYFQERKNFINQNNLLFSPNHPNQSIKTLEGRLPINELIGQLFNERSLAPFQQNRILSECATYIAQYYEEQNNDEQNFIRNVAAQIRKRLNQSAEFHFPSEVKCLVGVGFKQQNEPLATLLIDDGDLKRSKRKLLMRNNYEYIGGGCKQVKDSGLICGVYLLTNDIKQK